ncbi:endonuclease [Candidatus Woesearchaeota archaeon]|nr:endonuclease [Candidatus Woesearchaeota archaeon]
MAFKDNSEIVGIYDLLLDTYGKQGWWPINNQYGNKVILNEEEKFEICIGAILTQNTSWNNVEKALKNLRNNKLLNKEKLNEINEKELALLIKPSGYNNQKARKIKEFIKFLISKKEITRENLLNVWGIGEETADSILLYAYQKQIFVIDAYTKRIFSRLGMCKENIDYNGLQIKFHSNLKTNHKIFNEYHALIVKHAKEFCNKKPKCKNCPLRNRCKYFRKTY